MKSSCSVNGCTGTYKGLGFCNRHYQHFKKHGVPFKKTDLDRFWEKVDVRGPDECWPWIACLKVKGYGHFSVGRGTVTASRWILGELRGTALRWDEVRELACHTCDNRDCCNPAHLYVGTYSSNNQDAHDHGNGWTPVQRTHCLNGHPYSDENTHRNPKGERECRICRRESLNRYRRKRALRKRAESLNKRN